MCRPRSSSRLRPNYLSGPSAITASNTPLNIAVNYLKQNASAYGIESRDLDHYIVTNQYKDDHNGVTHIYLQQTYNGLPIADALASIHIGPTGRVLTAGINFVSDLPTPPPFSMPSSYTTATAALASLASQSNRPVNLSQVQSHPYGGVEQLVYFTGSGLGEFAYDHVSAKLHYVPKPNGSLELAWHFVTRYDDSTHWFEASVGTQLGGRVNQVIRLGDYVNHAAYYVYAQPVDNPLYGIQTAVIDPQDPTASPFGWHDINGFVRTGVLRSPREQRHGGGGSQRRSVSRHKSQQPDFGLQCSHHLAERSAHLHGRFVDQRLLLDEPDSRRHLPLRI